MVLMLDPFQLPFMQRAALEVILLAPIAGVLGAQIVLRHLAFFTHGVGAAAFPGLVIAGPAGIPPALAALGVGGGFAALLERLGRRTGLAYDAATALLLVGALAIGIVLASDVFESGSSVDQLLFGSLLAIGSTELLFTGATLAAVLIAAAAFRRSWIASGFDELGGGVLGLRTALADGILIGAVALAAIASLDAVGALLVSALLVVPAATARLFAPSVVALELGGAALALAEGLAGLLIAYHLDVPPGPAIAVLGGIFFAVGLTARELTAWGSGRSRPSKAGA
jgi:manganese/iron transport system permease protein